MHVHARAQLASNVGHRRGRNPPGHQSQLCILCLGVQCPINPFRAANHLALPLVVHRVWTAQTCRSDSVNHSRKQANPVQRKHLESTRLNDQDRHCPRPHPVRLPVHRLNQCRAQQAGRAQLAQAQAQPKHCLGRGPSKIPSTDNARGGKAL